MGPGPAVPDDPARHRVPERRIGGPPPVDDGPHPGEIPRPDSAVERMVGVHHDSIGRLAEVVRGQAHPYQLAVGVERVVDGRVRPPVL